MAVRPIDAERLSNDLKAYRQQYFGYGWYNEYAVLDQCLSLIDAQPTLTLPNEWVSVEDALPPEHEPVLCIVSGKPKPNITLEDAYQIGSWNKADGWIIDEYLDWEDADVSWWMPLPAPPDCRLPEGDEDT